MTSNIYLKRTFYLFVSMIMVMCMCIIPTYAWGRKLITKSASGSFSWTFYNYTYSFNAVAGITYNDNNAITQISDLSFNNVVCNSSSFNFPGSIIPRQTSKTFSGNTATYVVTVTRNAYGMYSDQVNYTFTYRTSDSGVPYSLGDNEPGIMVEVTVGEPYNIQVYE